MSEKHQPPRLTITRDGKPYEIFMSFGLLNELVRTIGDLEGVSEIASDQVLRDEVLQQIFSERNSLGQIEEPANLFLLDVSYDDIVLLLDWVGAHVLDFLLKQLVNAKNLGERNREELMGLMLTSPGSPDSTSETPSS